MTVPLASAPTKYRPLPRPSKPLTPGYETAILRKTGAGDLDEAHAKIRGGLVEPPWRDATGSPSALSRELTLSINAVE